MQPDRIVTLRRSLIARWRVIGLVEFVSFLLFEVLAAFWLVDVVGGRAAPVDRSTLVFMAVVWLPSLVVRVMVFSENVRADATGITWRGLLRTHHVPWRQIASIATGRIHLVPLFRRRGATCIELTLSNGYTRRLRPSVWCGSRARAEFIAGAAVVAHHPDPAVTVGTENPD